MANCSNCSAPLPSNTAVCRYCGTRNDMDFTAVGRFAVAQEDSGRICPLCEIPLESIRLTSDGAFVIERCKTCYGLFFDPGEIQAFLDASVAPAFEINFEEITHINRERADMDRPVRYFKCPVCRNIMNRVNFGYRSGVVMDQCRKHGVWLENGELVQLMEWKKAGGQLLDEQIKTERLNEERRKAEAAAIKTIDTGHFTFDRRTDNAPGDLVRAAFELVSKLFG